MRTVERDQEIIKKLESKKSLSEVEQTALDAALQRERARELARLRYASNPEKYRARARKWREKNPLSASIIANRYYTRISTRARGDDADTQ